MIKLIEKAGAGQSIIEISTPVMKAHQKKLKIVWLTWIVEVNRVLFASCLLPWALLKIHYCWVDNLLTCLSDSDFRRLLFSIHLSTHFHASSLADPNSYTVFCVCAEPAHMDSACRAVDSSKCVGNLQPHRPLSCQFHALCHSS